MTASCDRTGMPYKMHCQAQLKANKGAAEVITGLAEIIFTFIKEFIKSTGHKPRRILYFRGKLHPPKLIINAWFLHCTFTNYWIILFIIDGVGEGQFGEVPT